MIENFIKIKEIKDLFSYLDHIKIKQIEKEYITLVNL
jgi:hypothetical protein